MQPRIPVGTILLTEKNPPNETKARLWNHKNDQYESGMELEGDTKLQLIKQDPIDVANSTLYVKVLTGRYTGRTGWTLDNDLYTSNGIPAILTL